MPHYVFSTVTVLAVLTVGNPAPANAGDNNAPQPRQYQANISHEAKMAISNLDDLAEFYEARQRWDEMEQTLQRRADLPLILAQVRLIAENQDAQSALLAYYRLTNQPARELEITVTQLDDQIRASRKRLAQLHVNLAETQAQLEQMENHHKELSQQRHHLQQQLEHLHHQQLLTQHQTFEERLDQLRLNIESFEKQKELTEQAIADTNTTENERHQLQLLSERLSNKLHLLHSELRHTQLEANEHKSRVDEVDRAKKLHKAETLQHSLQNWQTTQEDLLHEVTLLLDRIEEINQHCKSASQAMEKLRPQKHTPKHPGNSLQTRDPQTSKRSSAAITPKPGNRKHPAHKAKTPKSKKSPRRKTNEKQPEKPEPPVSLQGTI